MALTLYFLRHGQTALSREDVFCGSGLDLELTPEGLEMAHAFVNAYHDADWRASISSTSNNELEAPRSELSPIRVAPRLWAEIGERF